MTTAPSQITLSVVRAMSGDLADFVLSGTAVWAVVGGIKKTTAHCGSRLVVGIDGGLGGLGGFFETCAREKPLKSYSCIEIEKTAQTAQKAKKMRVCAGCGTAVVLERTAQTAQTAQKI